MHDMLMDIIFELSEAQQALIMFGSMVLMIVLAIPVSYTHLTLPTK